MLLFLLGSLNVWGGDVIDNDATSAKCSGTATNTWVTDFSITGTSGAEYCIHTMGTKNTSNALQWNTNGFMNQTKSGGTLKSVTINGTNNKSVKIYAANSAYSTSKQTGTALATLNLTGADVTYTFENDYTYLALVGGASSTQIVSITIEYKSGGGSTPSISLDPSSLDLKATGNAQQVVELTATNFSGSVNSVECAFFSAATCQPSEAVSQPAWITDLTDNNSNQVSFNVADNSEGARNIWMKVTASDGSGSASAVLAIAQAKYVGPASLPFAFNDGKTALENTTGMSQAGLGSDYGSSPKLKFDDTGDYVIIYFNANPGTLSYDIKGNGFSGGTFTVQESADGADYTEVASYTSLGDVQNKENDLNSTSRYVKFVYTTKSSGNVALGNIVISKYVVPAAVATPTISGETPFLTTTEVTLTQAEADAIYYTTDGSDPKTSGTKQTYSAPFTINADGTTTVKAYAVKGSDESDVAEKTFTKITPLTVAEALVGTTGSGKYVTGTITSITEVNIGYKNATYVISDISEGIPQNEMIVYRGKYIDGADFTSADQIHVGDVVVVSGSIAVHAEKNQMAQGNQIVTISAPAVVAPVFEPNGGGFVISTDVTIASAGAEHIYYTTNGDNPTKASNEYTGAIPLDATTTIKAIAYVGEESSLVVEKTFTLTDPKTVAEAYDELVSADLENVAVEGIVYDLSISSGNATYWISDDGNAGAKVLEVFKGKGIEGADVAAGDIREGDKVIVFGTLTIYTGGSEDVKEFKQGSRLLSLTRKTVESVAVTGTPTKTNYKVGDAFDPAGLTVTVTYNDASHATVAVADCSWEKDPATFDAAGTGLSVSVKATYDGVQSPAHLVEGLNVKAVPTFDDPNYEWQLVTSDAQLVAGKYYVIAYTANNHTMKYAASGNFYETVSSIVSDGVIAYDALGENTAIFELGGSSSAWTFTEAINEVVLGATTSKNMSWGNNTTWTISIDENNASIANTNEDCGILMYNNSANPKRFKVYASTSTMSLPQLYVWALKTYKLRYDANGGEDAPAAQVADGEGKVTVTDAKPTAPADKVFDKWNTQNDGLGADKVAGDVIDLSAGDVTLYAIWRDPNTYSISYDANGGQGTMEPETDWIEGSQYTINDNEFTREGYNFTGWKAYDANDAELTVTNGKFIVPATNVTVKAQWGAWTVTEFVLVTDKAQLKDGDKVYIVAAKYERAIGTQNGTSYRNEVAIQKAGSSIKVMEGAEPVEFTLGRDGDNFTFKEGDNYLYSTTAKSVDVRSVVFEWAITIDENGTSISAGSAGTLQYNSSNPRFTTYTSSQKAVAIYKKADYTRAATEGRYGTICLPQAGQIIGATLYEVADKDDSKIYFDEILNGQMEAGKPYIFLPNSGESQLAVLYTSDEVKSVQPANGLVGFIGANADAEMDVPVGKYILNANQYRLVEHAGSAKIKSYRSYIDFDAFSDSSMPAPGRRRISMNYYGSQVATCVENAEANEAPRKVLINGELFILRGEKMYDATGRIVK